MFYSTGAPGGSDVPVLDEGVVEVTVEALLDVGHVFNGGNGANGDLVRIHKRSRKNSQKIS